MSLRINQNVTSLSTYSNLNATTNKMEKSIAKLSSGLRINTAADDATGLAISEKMRSQVRGLNRAKLNAQDGVSMIQTAEGGLNETESIIQRMRELAIQGSNDTLTSNDRLEIQKEINQLKTAIDDISTSTEFNTKKLLNGSQTSQLTSSSGSVSGLVTSSGAVAGDYQVSMTVLQGGISQMQRTQIFMDKDGNLAKGNTKLEDISQFYDENGVFALATAQTLTVTGNSNSAEVSINGKMTLNELASTLQNAIAGASHLGIKNSSVAVVNTVSSKVSGLGGYLEFTSGAIGESGQFSVAGEQKMMDALGISVTREAVNNVVQLRIQDTRGNIRTVNTSSDRATGLIDGMDIQFDSTAAQVAGNGGIVDGLHFGSTGSDLSVNFQFDTGTGWVTISVGFQASGNYSMEAIAKKINDAVATQTNNNTGFEASVVDGQIRLAYNPTNADAPTDINITNENKVLGFLTGTYSGFVDGEKNSDNMVRGISKLVDSTITSNISVNLIISVTDGANTNMEITVGKTVTISTMDTAGNVGDLVEAESFVLNTNSDLVTNSVNARVDIVNGSIAFTSTRLGQYNFNGGFTEGNLTVNADNGTATNFLNNTLGFKNGTVRGSGDTNYRVRVVDNTPVLQIGANAGQQMEISMSDMSTKALGIDRLDMSSSKGAQAAIEKLDQALSRVSAERSKLGAFSNRLQYTMNNLENTATNLTDAESRIRDVDMASEMISFTSSQIMQQAGTAMLAQANTLSSSVLSLLG